MVCSLSNGMPVIITIRHDCLETTTYYTLLDDVETDEDFKIKLCEWLSRDCCCALRYSNQKRLNRYYQENTDRFNQICGTNFTVEQMDFIYTYLGNGVKHELTKQFVSGGFDLAIIERYLQER